MKDHDYIQDITEMRSMMERSAKFLSLSGWSGTMAGIYALVGVYVASRFFQFHPVQVIDPAFPGRGFTQSTLPVIFIAAVVVVLAVVTVIYFSGKRAERRGEKLWNPTARRFLVNLSVPLVAGGLLSLILISKGMTGLLAPVTLIFYGISMYGAGKFTYGEIKIMGMIQIVLGLLSALYIPYGVVFWAIGFGAVHIIYGLYLHYKYEQ